MGFKALWANPIRRAKQGSYSKEDALSIRSKVFLVLFVHHRRCQRVQCKLACSLPSGEEENERSEVKKNGTLKRVVIKRTIN